MEENTIINGSGSENYILDQLNQLEEFVLPIPPDDISLQPDDIPPLLQPDDIPLLQPDEPSLQLPNIHNENTERVDDIMTRLFNTSQALSTFDIGLPSTYTSSFLNDFNSSNVNLNTFDNMQRMINLMERDISANQPVDLDTIVERAAVEILEESIVEHVASRSFEESNQLEKDSKKNIKFTKIKEYDPEENCNICLERFGRRKTYCRYRM